MPDALARPHPPLRSALAAVAAAIAVTVLAVRLHRAGLDLPLFRAVNGWRGLPDGVCEALGVAGLGLTALVVFLVGAERHLRLVATLPWMLAVGGGLTVLFKRLTPLPRPVAALDGVRVIGPELHQRSMPSGHTLTAVAVVVVLWLAGGPFWRRRAPLALAALLAAAVALSRVVSGVHWPADVVAGAALGGATGVASVSLAGSTGTERWLATAPGRWLLRLAQLGSGVALVLDQGYGRILAIQWVLAILVIASGTAPLAELAVARVRAARRAALRRLPGPGREGEPP